MYLIACHRHLFFQRAVMRPFRLRLLRAVVCVAYRNAHSFVAFCCLGPRACAMRSFRCEWVEQMVSVPCLRSHKQQQFLVPPI